MKDEILQKVYETDTAPIPRYRLVDSEGKTLIEGIEIQLQNPIDQEGTPYNAQSILPDDLAQVLCPDIENPTPADALRALKSLTVPDGTLSVAGKAADAAATGEALAGKAPAGYGLGRQTGLTKITTLAQMDGTANCGWYDVALTDGNIGGMTKGGLRVDASPHGITQTFFGYSAASTPEIFECKRVWTSNTQAWGEWEWKNPPMWHGVEYRTTERLFGQPVYVRYIHIGSIPANNEITADVGIAANKVVSMEIMSYSSSYNVAMPLPHLDSNNGSISMCGWITGGVIHVKSFVSFTGYSAFAIIKYTK